MKLETINKIKALKIVNGFFVSTKTQQQDVLRTAQTLRQMGLITFRVVTTKMVAGGWKVVAV